MRKPRVMKIWKVLTLAALTLCAACSSFRYEPTANWERDGGRLCALNRDVIGEWDRAAPRQCPQNFSEAVPPEAGKQNGAAVKPRRKH
jgi:hypothetical protein